MIDPLTALTAAFVLTFLAALLFWPEKGIYARWKKALRTTERVLCEDALKHIYKFELEDRQASLESIAGAAQVSLDRAGDLVAQLEDKGLLSIRGGRIRLTPGGRNYALHVIRTHRLWERYLAERTGYSEAEWHTRAEEQEHRLSPKQADALSARLGNPTHDPHGDPIPTAEGEMVSNGGKPLTLSPLDVPLRIVHLEDEPPAVYAQLVADGLHPGQTVRVTESTPQGVRFWVDGEECVLAPMAAANVTAVEAPQEEPQPEVHQGRLSDLHPGQKGRVTSVSPTCRGLERRRFMDLGILPGTIVEVEMTSPSGDPTAYKVRGSTIALRREQAGHIHVEPLAEAS